MLAALTTLGVQIITLVNNIVARKEDKKDRLVVATTIADKVDSHNAVVSEKLEENTKLTLATLVKADAGVVGADKAYTEANCYNARQEDIQRDLKTLKVEVKTRQEDMQRELRSLSEDVHQVKSVLLPLVGAIASKIPPTDP